MNAHERATTLRQRSAALALTMAPQALAIHSQLMAMGTGELGGAGAIHWPQVDPDANDGMGDFVTMGYWKVGDAVGSGVLGPTGAISDEELERWGAPEV